MSFPTEQQVEAVAHALYGLDLDSWEDIVEATRIALTALAPEWREMERDAERWRAVSAMMTHEHRGDAVGWTLSVLLPGDDPDAAIDAARAGGEG